MNKQFAWHISEGELTFEGNIVLWFAGPIYEKKSTGFTNRCLTNAVNQTPGGSNLWVLTSCYPFHSQVKKSTFSQPSKEKFISEVVRISNIIISFIRVSYESQVLHTTVSDVIVLQEKFEIWSFNTLRGEQAVNPFTPELKKYILLTF